MTIKAECFVVILLLCPLPCLSKIKNLTQCNSGCSFVKQCTPIGSNAYYCRTNWLIVLGVVIGSIFLVVIVGAAILLILACILAAHKPEQLNRILARFSKTKKKKQKKRENVKNIVTKEATATVDSTVATTENEAEKV
uniref:PTTG1IP n=1 Tax=Panagrolaimus sp. JU765 TaxID=591449 RepID=A0AC34Q0Q1_9BILA